MDATTFRASERDPRVANCASAGYGRPSGPGMAAQSPNAHTVGWLVLRMVASTTIRPRGSCATGILTAAAFGTIPAVKMIVPASMDSSARWTRPGSIARTGVPARM
jgi:hypothetical protein